jgi:hypothetical protein
MKEGENGNGAIDRAQTPPFHHCIPGYSHLGRALCFSIRFNDTNIPLSIHGCPYQTRVPDIAVVMGTAPLLKPLIPSVVNEVY